MRQIIALLLITSVILGDTLILKDKSVYNGTFIKYDNDKIIFKALPSANLSVSVSDIQEIKLSNGTKIFDNGIMVLTDLETFEKYDLPWTNSNEIFSIKMKAISDANSKPMGHWLVYTSLVPASFFGQLYLILKNNMIDGHILENPMYLFANITSSILLPMFILKNSDKIIYPKSIIDESERKEYKTVYFNRLAERRILYILGGAPCTAVIGGIGLWWFAQGIEFDSLPKK